MCTVFDDLAVIEHDDTVEFCDSAQTVSDDNTGTSFYECIEAGLDELFRLTIERAGGFIKHEDRRVF